MLQKEGLKIAFLFLSWLLYQTTQREGSTTTFKGKRKVKTGARKLLPLSGFIPIDLLLASFTLDQYFL